MFIMLTVILAGVVALINSFTNWYHVTDNDIAAIVFLVAIGIMMDVRTHDSVTAENFRTMFVKMNFINEQLIVVVNRMPRR